MEENPKLTMENNLRPEERLDELHRNGYYIIQNPKKFVLEWMQFCFLDLQK